MNHTTALAHLDQGQYIRRDNWEPTKKIRAAHIGDMDCIAIKDIKGVFVEDFIKELDCKVRIYNFTEDDITADNWEVIIK